MSQQQDVSATGPCLLSYRISETVQQLELGHMTCYPSLSPLLLSQLSPVSWTTTINKTLFYPSHKTQSLHIPGEDTLKRYHLAFFLPLPSQKTTCDTHKQKQEDLSVMDPGEKGTGSKSEAGIHGKVSSILKY